MSDISMKNSYFLHLLLLLTFISFWDSIREVNGQWKKLCRPNSFLCKDGVTCAGNQLKCDGYKDCPDGSDEENCYLKSCPSNSFLCKDGETCAGNEVKCDGYKDCPDGSDEENCSDIGFCQKLKNNTYWACVESKSCWYYAKYRDENRLDDYTPIQHCGNSNHLICCPEKIPGSQFCRVVKGFDTWECRRKSECSYYDATKDQNIASDDGRAIKCSPADDEICCPPQDSPQICGIAPMMTFPHDFRILGGKNAEFGAWPWQVSLRIKEPCNASSAHFCGGVILNENWIITARHCFLRLKPSQIEIRAGEYDFSTIAEPYPFVTRDIAKIVFHPLHYFSYKYDLALLKLDSPLNYDKHIVPICLPKSDDLLIGKNAIVIGWGELEYCGKLPSVLQQVSVTIFANAQCENMLLTSANISENLTDKSLCAGSANGGRDACHGDSGGPLQIRGKDGRYFLAGIVSWGTNCTQSSLPSLGIYVRISKFIPWILRTIGGRN